jgi:hypothetical protein
VHRLSDDHLLKRPRQAADTIAQWEAALQIDLYEFQVRS